MLLIKPLCRLLAPLVLLGLWPALATAGPDTVLFRQDEQATPVAVSALRERADVSFIFFDPYLAEEVAITGLIFRDLLIEQFGEVPDQLAFTAWDDYEVTLGGWDDPNWILVTHQNGEPLGLKERGPVRLVERDYGDRDIANLRNFNDWVWMIREIEAAR